MTRPWAAPLIRFRERARLPMLRQTEAAECGLACLAMILSYHGRPVDLGTLRRRFPTSLRGATLLDVAQMAGRLGLTSRGVRVEPESLRYLRMPAILHWSMNHFVVLEKVTSRGIVIRDPARGVRQCSRDDVERSLTGVALELSPGSAFEQKSEIRRLPMKDVIGKIEGLGSILGQALLLSVLLQIFVLAGPLYMQLAVDQAVGRGDSGILLALAFGFGFLGLFHVGAEWLRGRVLLGLAGVMSFQLMGNLFHHLLKLPLSWFEKRHIGDLVSRFGSTRPIKDLIANDLVAVAVDGSMAILTLIMIFVYSPLLATIVLGALILNMILRVATFRSVWARQEEVIEATAKEQTTFMESARVIQAIKLFNRERDREELWQNRLVEVINQSQALGRIQIDLKLYNDLIFVLENVLIVYLGALQVISADLTVGMLFAFMAYKAQLVDKASRLLETAIQFRMLDLHLERIADIALSEPEEGRDREPLVATEIRGSLELRDVFYRYSLAEPFVVQGVSMTIDAGDFVAITGPSGHGKTTLMKLMLGLLKPESGQVLVDGLQLDHLGPSVYRKQVAAVMQEDQLLSGSLAENISFFDNSPDLDRIRESAAMAGLDEEIMAMPMNYNSLVGDMGTALSGGQKQRLLLARALYSGPRILFMDEGTSHLDLAKERQVNDALKQINITRIVVAHRPETIAAADKVFNLQSGRFC